MGPSEKSFLDGSIAFMEVPMKNKLINTGLFLMLIVGIVLVFMNPIQAFLVSRLSADLVPAIQNTTSPTDWIYVKSLDTFCLSFFFGATSRMDCSTSQVARQSGKSL